jgi:hypothetical protein
MAAHRRTWLSAALVCALLPACHDSADRATVIDPVYEDPCRFTSCSDHGLCMATEQGTPECLCDVGYATSSCAHCEPDFHIDARGRCASDRACAELSSNPCGLYGSCDDSLGVIGCHCDPAYEGPRCTLCKTGYGRNEFGECLELVLSDGSMPDPLTPCGADPCHGHGTCSDQEGEVSCACEAGYEGMRCDRCGSGYHRDVEDACVVNEACAPNQCGEHGSCQDSSGQALCFCEDRYAGERCNDCAVGFHPGEGGCVLDEQCQAHSCPEHASCEDATGHVVCTCAEGYAGPKCGGCAAGYARDAHGECVEFVCDGNPIGAPGRVDWDMRSDFPSFDNNCISGLSADNEDVAFTSIGGDGQVWSCATNTVYHLDSNHVFLEAGQAGPAELAFRGPIADLTFDYAARSALALEIRADGVVVRTLTAIRRSTGTITLSFSPPISLLSLRSIGDATNQIALDNIVYTPPACH